MADSPEHNKQQETRGRHAAADAHTMDGGLKEQGKEKARTKGKRAALIVILVVCLMVAAAGVAYLVWNQVNNYRAMQSAQGTDVPSTQAALQDADASNNQSSVAVLPQNPVDFSALKLENPDIYAWIYVPNTQVNHPVVQHPTDDSYYLTHDVDGNANGVGAIYTEMQNATDFSDPVTVLYGHNIAEDLMFASLHNFENEEFFNQNQTMYVYRPGHVFTYTIVAAYQYDDRHILNSFDFSNPTTLQSYYAGVLNPESLLVNKRSGAQLQTSDKIIQLSTCMTSYSYSNTRYIVTGVLINDEQTQ